VACGRRARAGETVVAADDKGARKNGGEKGVEWLDELKKMILERNIERSERERWRHVQTGGFVAALALLRRMSILLHIYSASGTHLSPSR
jgi:hypothetical protein